RARRGTPRAARAGGARAADRRRWAGARGSRSGRRPSFGAAPGRRTGRRAAAGPPGPRAPRATGRSALPPAQEDRERPEPLALGREDDVPDAERGERRRDLVPLGRRRSGEPGAQLRAPRVDPELPAGLGVDEPELAHVRELLLARIADLDRDDVVPPREREQRPPPVERAAEVGDEDDERALARN